MNLGQYGKRIIEDYLAEVRASLQELSDDEREAICEDLRAHIEQALEDTAGDEPSAAHVHEVLSSLGDPAEYAPDGSPGPLVSSTAPARRFVNSTLLAIAALVLIVLGELPVVLTVLAYSPHLSTFRRYLWHSEGSLMALAGLVLAGFVLGREWGSEGNRASRALAGAVIAIALLAFVLSFTRTVQVAFM